MRLEERTAAAKLVRHASQRPHVAGEAPLQVQNDFGRAICSSCDQTSLRRGRAGNTSKVDETEMMEVGFVVLRDSEHRSQRGQRQGLCRECPRSGRTSHSLGVRNGGDEIPGLMSVWIIWQLCMRPKEDSNCLIKTRSVSVYMRGKQQYKHRRAYNHVR